VNAVTATSHHLHGPGCSRPVAVALPGFRHSMNLLHTLPSP